MVTSVLMSTTSICEIPKPMAVSAKSAGRFMFHVTDTPTPDC